MAADPPPTHRRTAVILAAVAVVALLVAGSIYLATRSTPAHKQVAAPLRTVSPTLPPAPSPSPSPTTATPKPVKPAVPHDYVAAAAPSSFSFSSKTFTIKARVCGMEYVRPLDPPGEQHHTVCWVQHDFGFAPGSKAKGTTYVLGHAWGQDSQEVLNKISETAMRQVLPARRHGATTTLAGASSGVLTYPVTRLNGDVISLHTRTGVLRYTVRSAYAVAKSQAGYITALMAEHTRNRVVLITCGELNHVDYDYNIIVQAYLTSSSATKATT